MCYYYFIIIHLVKVIISMINYWYTRRRYIYTTMHLFNDEQALPGMPLIIRLAFRITITIPRSRRAMHCFYCCFVVVDVLISISPVCRATPSIQFKSEICIALFFFLGRCEMHIPALMIWLCKRQMAYYYISVLRAKH